MRLIVSDLAAERGGEIIFSDLNFSVSGGQAMVVTGPNGSGKSTLLRIICELLPAAYGEVQLEIGAEMLKASSLIHYLGHQNAMKPALSVRENLDFWQKFHGEKALEIEDALEAVGLPDIDHLPFGYLSTGQKRRVSIAKLLMSDRPIWVVDEPTAGLDRASEKRFAELMGEKLEDGGIIVAATHIPLGLAQVMSVDIGDYSMKDEY